MVLQILNQLIRYDLRWNLRKELCSNLNVGIVKGRSIISREQFITLQVSVRLTLFEISIYEFPRRGQISQS